MTALSPWNRRTGLGGAITAYFHYSGLEIAINIIPKQVTNQNAQIPSEKNKEVQVKENSLLPGQNHSFYIINLSLETLNRCMDR